MNGTPAIIPYKPRDAKPYPLAYESVELFIDCAKCFFLQHRRQIARRPPMDASFADSVKRKWNDEFDGHRAAGTAHPLVTGAKISSAPFQTPLLHEWRTAGIAFHDPWTNFALRSRIEDVWINNQGELNLVGYVPLASPTQIGNFDEAWHLPLKRRIELGMWLLRQQEIAVAGTTFWLAASVDEARLLSYKARDGWVRAMLAAVKDCLEADREPPPSAHCEVCQAL